MMRVTTHTGADAPIHDAHFIVNAYVGHDRSELMIRDYWLFPRRDASRSRQDFHDEQEPERPSRNARERGDVDWDRMPDPEALRWSPRAARREREAGPSNSRENNRLEGYGYGDS
jgi:hypothetical protein